MPVLAIETEHSDPVAVYFKKVDDKLKEDFFVTHMKKVPNIMKGNVYRFESYPMDVYVVYTRYMLPCVTPYIAGFLAIPILIFNQLHFTPLWLIPIFFLLLSFFWTKWFVFLVQKHSLRKIGYQGNINLKGDKEIIDLLIARLHMQANNDYAK